MKYTWKRISPRCILKVDLQKAFDFVQWDFLQDALHGLGFPLQFVVWIMEFVTTTSFSVAINGGVYGHFKGGHNLR